VYLAKLGKSMWKKVYNTSVFVVYKDSVFNHNINVMRQTNIQKYGKQHANTWSTGSHSSMTG